MRVVPSALQFNLISILCLGSAVVHFDVTCLVLHILVVLLALGRIIFLILESPFVSEGSNNFVARFFHTFKYPEADLGVCE